MQHLESRLTVVECVGDKICRKNAWFGSILFPVDDDGSVAGLVHKIVI